MNTTKFLTLVSIVLCFGAGVYLVVGGIWHSGYGDSTGWSFDELEIALGCMLIKVSSLINTKYQRDTEYSKG
jgi:hypothetical protein